jgi:hypothetical protein
MSITIETLPILKEHADIHGNVLLSRENMHELFTLARAALMAEPQLRAMIGSDDNNVDFRRWASAMLEPFPKARLLRTPPSLTKAMAKPQRLIVLQKG